MKKPENMKMYTRTATRPNQLGDANLASDGMATGSSQRATKGRYAYNQHGGAAEGNFGRGPTKGNHGTLSGSASCTPPVSAVPTLPAQGSIRDSINRGHQVRNPGGTRSFEPSAGQNYKGNPDMINAGRGPTKGNQC